VPTDITKTTDNYSIFVNLAVLHQY